MKLNYNHIALESLLNKTPVTPGNIYFTEDTGHIWLDPINGETRVLIGSDYVYNATISVRNASGGAATGIYVNIYHYYDNGTKLLYDRVAYNGTSIVVALPKNFNYFIVPDEIPGYDITGVSGKVENDLELSFNYTESKIYGVTWDKSANTILGRTGAAALFEDPKPYIKGATTYGSPFDNIMPWAGMTVSRDSGVGALVAIPKYWYRWTNSSNALTLEITNSAVEGFSVSPAHRDRGDGKGERDVVYIGRYHCSATDYRSETAVLPKVSETRAAFRTNIRSLGNTVYMNDYALFWTIRMLYLVEYADWDSQKVIGYGRGNGSAVEKMGYTDSMPYHTGTMLSSRTTYGVGTQYRNIEGVWDNCVDWCDGIYFSEANVYAIMNPNMYSDNSNGTFVCTRLTTGGYISAWQFSSADQFDWFMYPSQINGSDKTYMADYCYYGPVGVVLFVGGYYGQSLQNGLFFLAGVNGASGTAGYIGSRLMVLP